MKNVDGLLDDGVDLGKILSHVFLRELEKGSFGLLHKFFDIDALVEGFRLDGAGKGDELAGKKFLGQDGGVVFDVGRRGDVRTELDDVGRTTHFVEGAVAFELLGDGHDVDGLLVHVEGADGGVDLLMTRLVEGLGTEELADDGEGVFIDHEGTEDDFL